MLETCCDNHTYVKMAPGQEPYTCVELAELFSLISDAADEDPGEDVEEEYLREQC